MTPRHEAPALAPRAAGLLRKALGPSVRLTAVAGDASSRRFYRARGSRGTAIVMIHPPPLEDLSAFVTNHRILSEIGAPVPPLIAVDERSGVVIVGDLGDRTLQRHLLGLSGRRAAAAKRDLYRQACDLIVLFQRRAPGAMRGSDFAARNALDGDRFRFELDHFHRHFVGGLRRLRPRPADERLLRRFYDDLARECADLPRVYCHRDFQSRNLMVRRGRIHLIDFQDARMGPYTYDAASLLRDSSLDVGEDLAREMIDRLARDLGCGPEEFRRDFDRVALQRNIKDLGTFAYLATERGLVPYLGYVPRTIRSIRENLVRSRRYDPIYACLEEHILSYTG